MRKINVKSLKLEMFFSLSLNSLQPRGSDKVLLL